MATYEFYSGGELHRLQVGPMDSVRRRILEVPQRVAAKPVARKSGVAVKSSLRRGGSTSPKPQKKMAEAISKEMVETLRAVHAQNERLGPLFHATRESDMQMVVPKPTDPLVLVTDTVVVDKAAKKDIAWLRDKYGMEVLRHGLQGKVLLKSPEGGQKGTRLVFEASKEAVESGRVAAAHPNFVRLLPQVKPSSDGGQQHWNYDNTGKPEGKAGCDVAARAAWTITRGTADIRVAVLDEGVDTRHPALKQAVVAEKDFVDDNPTAMPDGDDAHGTACAGIIVSRDPKYGGIAPECGLVAIRIAKGDGKGGWIFDDFATADAIDWAWQEAKADVLSNSWGGGPPVDVIVRAVNRARTKGRGGKGAIVVCAAGNENGRVNFPATMEAVMSVGASNQWDERKSPTSSDNETWWGSNFGRPLNLLAPGVKIATTDIQGARGYSKHDFTLTFNGTSAATPHVAAAAALILSIAPGLNGDVVRAILDRAADRLAKSEWDKYVGHGRLNIFSALRLARRSLP